MRRSNLWDLPVDKLQEVANTCTSVSEMLSKLGYARNSGSMAKVLKKVIAEYQIDISHFSPYRRNNSYCKYELDKILVPNSTYVNISRLKKRIIKAGLLKYECEWCGNKGEWNNKPLTLQLDHKNGDHTNHSIENLRFLCPNCHSQTDTFGSKNIKIKKQQRVESND